MKLNFILLIGFVILALMLTVACTAAPSPPTTSPTTTLPTTTLPTTSPPATSPTTTSPPPTSPTVPPGAPTVTLNISAQNYAFDKSTLAVHMGTMVTLVFDNKDSVPHNVAIYKDSSATTVIFRKSSPGRR